MEIVEEGGQNQPKIKTVEEEEEEKEDVISLLPDCLLNDILTRLDSTKEAIRTGSLSKRWEHLWTYLPNLIFINDDSNDKFLSSVGKTLSQCRQPNLNKFQLHTRYDIQFESQVNSLISYAIDHNVRDFDLLILRSSPHGFTLDQHSFFTSCFTRLKLGNCMLNPTGAICWRNLKTLVISSGKLDEDLFQNIFSGSPLLKTLILHKCYGFRLIDITSKSVKYLFFSGFNDPEQYPEDQTTNIVEINAPYITSLKIDTWQILSKLLLLNMSSLVKAEINFEEWVWSFYGPTHQQAEEKAQEEILEGLILNLRHVKKLKIGCSCNKIMSRLEAKGFIIPSNVTY